MKQKLMDRIPKRGPLKPVSGDIPISKRERFLKALAKNGHTQRDVIEAAVDQYLEESEKK